MSYDIYHENIIEDYGSQIKIAEGIGIVTYGFIHIHCCVSIYYDVSQ